MDNDCPAIGQDAERVAHVAIRGFARVKGIDEDDVVAEPRTCIVASESAVPKSGERKFMSTPSSKETGHRYISR
jgi:hypothetical protein